MSLIKLAFYLLKWMVYRLCKMIYTPKTFKLFKLTLFGEVNSF